MEKQKMSGLETTTSNEGLKTPPIYEKVHANSFGKYSKSLLSAYDRERHMPLEDAYSLVVNQEDSNLDVSKLKEAVEKQDIKVYDFKGQEYVDRIDVGRVFHTPVEKPKGLSFERYFSKEGESPFDSINYETRDLEIKDFKENKIIFSLKNAEVPDWMDDVSAQIVAQKYFFKPDRQEWKDKLKATLGVDHERSVKHLNKRVTDFFTDEGWKLGYFATEEDREIFRDELLSLQANGVGAFNSPTQFNAGLYNSYGVEGSSGINYYNDPETGDLKKVTNGEYIHPQLHACFIKGPNDDLESIAKNAVDEIGIFSSGSGIGHDIGKIRAEGEKLSGGGEASGPLSFWGIYDKIAGTIKSGGKTRRAARMTTMRYTHPDSMKFIKSKVNEDHKALKLMELGYSPGMDGEAYTTVSFQNTNISVRLDDKFFESLEKGKDVELYEVDTGKVNGKVSADRMLKEISFGSWRIGDPAVQFEDKIQEMHPAKNSGRQNSSNPCSEYLFLDDTSCSLFSLKLTHFMGEDGKINVDDFKKAYRVFTIAQNIANRAASYPVEDIARLSPEFATIGGGYADLGSLLIREGMPYDSDEGRNLAGGLTALMTGTVYETSAEIAKNVGSFEHFAFNKKPMMEVMSKHQRNLEEIAWEKIDDEGLKLATYESWKNVLKEGEEHGFSNAQATVLAPTGTISYLMGCSTQGIEPAMSLSITKNLAGGGNVVIANKDVEVSLKNLGYTEDQIKDVSAFVGKYNTIRDAPHVKMKDYRIFDTSFGNASGQGSISFEGHLKMVAAAQPFISGAISKTNNLPERATVKDHYDGFKLAHKLGLKAISTFRNNSKPISALNFEGKEYKKLERGQKEDLPPRRDVFETEVEIDGTPFHIMASEYEDGRPGQITFLSYKAGSTLGATLSTAGVLASKSLKRGVHLEDVTESWLGQQFEPNGFVKGHKYIKTASSPLDFAAKSLRLEYLGETDLANDPSVVDKRDLRGAKTGAFRAYKRANVDEWNVDHVLEDPETGGFVEGGEDFSNGNGNKKNANSKGLTCGGCGHVMRQTGPNCYECTNCPEKRGGCGA